jgi:hypothetical protein
MLFVSLSLSFCTGFHMESWLVVAPPRETSTGVVTGGGGVPPHEVENSAVITWRLTIDAPGLEPCYLVV